MLKNNPLVTFFDFFFFVFKNTFFEKLENFRCRKNNEKLTGI